MEAEATALYGDGKVTRSRKQVFNSQQEEFGMEFNSEPSTSAPQRISSWEDHSSIDVDGVRLVLQEGSGMPEGDGEEANGLPDYLYPEITMETVDVETRAAGGQSWGGPSVENLRSPEVANGGSRKLPMYLMNPNHYIHDPKLQSRIRRATNSYRYHQDIKKHITNLQKENTKLRIFRDLLQTKIMEAEALRKCERAEEINQKKQTFESESRQASRGHAGNANVFDWKATQTSPAQRQPKVRIKKTPLGKKILSNVTVTRESTNPERAAATSVSPNLINLSEIPQAVMTIPVAGSYERKKKPESISPVHSETASQIFFRARHGASSNYDEISTVVPEASVAPVAGTYQMPLELNQSYLVPVNTLREAIFNPQFGIFFVSPLPMPSPITAVTQLPGETSKNEKSENWSDITSLDADKISPSPTTKKRKTFSLEHEDLPSTDTQLESTADQQMMANEPLDLSKYEDVTFELLD